MVSESAVETIRAYVNEREWNKAIALGTKTLENDPNYLEIYPFLAKAYAQKGDLTKAIAAYEEALRGDFNKAQIHAELGLLYSRIQQLKEASHHYQKALEIKPDWAELQYNLGVVFHQLEEWDKSIAAYSRALKLKPNYSAVYFNLGVLYDRGGKSESAIEHYQKAIKLEPNHVRAYNNLGSSLAKKKKYEDAVKVLQQGLNIDPTWSTLHNNLGQVFWLNEQPDKALSSFEYAVMLNPQMSLAHHNLSNLWRKQGNYPATTTAIQKVVELEPSNGIGIGNYTSILLGMGDLEGAISQMKRSLNLQPQFAKYYIKKARELEQGEDVEDLLAKAKISCANFLESLQKQEELPILKQHLAQTYSNWGDALYEYGGYQQAVGYYQQALNIEPKRVELYLPLGNSLAKLERYDAAMNSYQMGLAIQSDNPELSFHLGKLLEAKYSPSSAIDYYEAILDSGSQQKVKSHKLSNLFPDRENLSSLPDKIYHHTHDWIRKCELEDYQYVEVPWEGTTPEGKKDRKRFAETIAGSEEKKTYAECGGVNCTSCMKNLIELFDPIPLQSKTYLCSELKSSEINTPLPFVVTIPQGKAWIAPQENSWKICNSIAITTPDNFLIGDLSRYYPWFLPGCPYQEKTRHNIYELDSLPPVEKLKGKVAVLSGLAGHVYYHWMFDIIPRLELIKRSGISLDTIDWFVINNTEKPFQEETLNCLGIPQDKIICSDRQPYIQAEELIVPSFPGHLDWVPLGTLKYLRQTFLPKISLNSYKYPQKIYISRSKSRARHLINEEEVLELLNSLGFVTIFLEDMPVLEQVALFANAKVIVTAHGSGLTNLVFCAPETTVVELFSPYYLRTDYWIISQQLQLKHYYSVGENFDSQQIRSLMNQNPLTEDILVNLDSLKLILKLADVTK